jgi:hypothetical protein
MENTLEYVDRSDLRLADLAVAVNGLEVPTALVVSADVAAREVWVEYPTNHDRGPVRELKTGTVSIVRAAAP